MNNLKLHKPLKNIWITQPFGANYVDFYKNLGMKGHNGIDFRAPIGTEVLATHDGIVMINEIKGGYGNAVLLKTDNNEWQTIYAHLKESDVNVNQRVRAGDVIALADNTGQYTTGSHLHFGLRPSPYNPNNGYFGWVDPAPYFEEGWNKLPVDNFYGEKRRWLDEFKMRFKNRWLHNRMIKKYYRNPPILSNRETNALVYGFWGADEVLNPSLTHIWLYLTKPGYLAGERPPF